MPRYLSTEWLDALDRAVNASTALRERTQGRRLVIEQTVTEAPGGVAGYHLRIDDGTIEVREGPTDAPDVKFVTDYATAVAINTGVDSAQAAFMRGRLRLGGEVNELVRNSDLLSLMDDVFAPIRAETSY